LEIGFFHADPHPGNLFLLDDGRLCFIDCGMAGRVDEETTRDLAMLIYGVSKADLDKVYEAFMSLGNVDETTVDVRDIRRDLQDFLDQYTNVSFSQIDMSSVLRTFTEGLRKHKIKCPSDIVMMIKALTTIEGVAEEIDPDFDLIGFSKPHVERLVKRQFSLPAIKRRLQKNASTWLKLIENLPGNLSHVLGRLGRNELAMHLEVEGVEKLNKTLHHSSRQISYSMLISAMIMASAVLVLAAGKEGDALRWVGGFGFLLSFLLALGILFENLVRRR
jgi:ubiquinone biosynthesis protein